MPTSPSRAKNLIGPFYQVRLNQVFENMTYYIHGALLALRLNLTDLLKVRLAVRVAGFVRLDPIIFYGDQKTGAY